MKRVELDQKFTWGLHAHTSPAVNIYSHLMGAALFVALPLYLSKAEIPPRYLVATTEDIIVCTIYFTGVAICFCLSAMFAKLSFSKPLKTEIQFQIPHGDEP